MRTVVDTCVRTIVLSKICQLILYMDRSSVFENVISEQESIGNVVIINRKEDFGLD